MSQREILELKSTVAEMEISLDGFNRLSRQKKEICELEDN